MITSVKNKKEISHNMRTQEQSWSEGSFYGVPCLTSRISSGFHGVAIGHHMETRGCKYVLYGFYLAIYIVKTSKEYTTATEYSMRKEDAHSDLMPTVIYHFVSCNNIIIHDNIIASVYNLRPRHNNYFGLLCINIRLKLS